MVNDFFYIGQRIGFGKGQYIGKTPHRVKGLKEGDGQYTIRHEGYEDFEARQLSWLKLKSGSKRNS